VTPQDCCHCSFDDQYGYKYCDYGGGEQELLDAIVYLKGHFKEVFESPTLRLKMKYLVNEVEHNNFNNPAVCSFMYWLNTANGSIKYRAKTLIFMLMIMLII